MTDHNHSADSRHPLSAQVSTNTSQAREPTSFSPKCPCRSVHARRDCLQAIDREQTHLDRPHRPATRRDPERLAVCRRTELLSRSTGHARYEGASAPEALMLQAWLWRCWASGGCGPPSALPTPSPAFEIFGDCKITEREYLSMAAEGLSMQIRYNIMGDVQYLVQSPINQIHTRAVAQRLLFRLSCSMLRLLFLTTTRVVIRAKPTILRKQPVPLPNGSLESMDRFLDP